MASSNAQNYSTFAASVQPQASTPNYSEVGWLSYLSFRWVTPLVETGAERQVTLPDAPDLGPDEDTFSNTELLLTLLRREEKAKRSHPLLRAVMSAYWKPLVCLQLMKMANHFLGLANPLILARILVFQESQNSGTELNPEQVTSGIRAIGTFIALGIFNIFFSKQIEFMQQRVGTRMGSALRGAVLTRCVHGQEPNSPDGSSALDRQALANKHDQPAVYNVISFDVGPNISIIWIIMSVWLFPVEFTSTLIALYLQVRFAAFPGLLVVILGEIVIGIMLYHHGRLRNLLFEAKDTRLSRCSEAFTNVRALQMLAWSGPFEERILEARREELRLTNLRLWLFKMNLALSGTLTMLVTLVTLAYFVRTYSDGVLKASVAIPVIALVGSLIGPFGQFPTWLNEYLTWRSAYDRVNRYMGLTSDQSPSDDGGSTPPASSVPRFEGDHLLRLADGQDEGAATTEDSAGAVAGYQACTLTWCEGEVCDTVVEEEEEEDLETPLLCPPPLPSTLRELELQCTRGRPLVLVGTEGQGKSSALYGLLGEMTLVSGSVHSPAIARRAQELSQPTALPKDVRAAEELLSSSDNGRGFGFAGCSAVAYASQDPALFTGTVQSNVLFNARLDNTIYRRVIAACALDADLSTMPAGDLTEIASGGMTLSGGQRARIGLARAVYRAVLDLNDSPDKTPLVLLDDPLCALDRTVARQVLQQVVCSPNGLLAQCAVVIATADPWWLVELSEDGSSPSTDTCVAVMRDGVVAARGTLSEVRGMGVPELEPMRAAELSGIQSTTAPETSGSANEGGEGEDDDGVNNINQSDYNETSVGHLKAPFSSGKGLPMLGKMVELTPEQKGKAQLLKAENREVGHVKWHTYQAYLSAIGGRTLASLVCALVGIMFFQELTTLWITYWADDHKDSNFMHRYVLWFADPVPDSSYWLLRVYGLLVLLFAISNVAGHGLEIVGGMGAASAIFQDALAGTLGRPFRWWDANPTGRVLNRFAEDVNVMDEAITNILGVIFGAVLYFIGHTFILGLANPLALLLLPIIAVAFEYIAKYYRRTIREVHRIYLVNMSSVYQSIVESVIHSTTIRAYATSPSVVCRGLYGLHQFQRISFIKQSINLWIGVRCSLIGYTLSILNVLYPILQYYGYLAPQSAALIGFSIRYSSETTGIIQQFIMNFSDLEMQLVSIERLQEFAGSSEALALEPSSSGCWAPSDDGSSGGENVLLQLEDVAVSYREGLAPALRGVTLSFGAGEKCAIVGRTGAGKSSMLLAVTQLVPYSGRILVDGLALGSKDPRHVRQHVVGVVPQTPVIFEGSLRWNLDPEGIRTDDEIWDALAAVGLTAACRGEGRGLSSRIVSFASTSAGGKEARGDEGEELQLTLSQGQKQLLSASRVLLRRPRVAMLDEVAASLPASLAKGAITKLLNRFSEIDATVLLVTHQQELAALCDRVITVSSGQILSDVNTTSTISK